MAKLGDAWVTDRFGKYLCESEQIFPFHVERNALHLLSPSKIEGRRRAMLLRKIEERWLDLVCAGQPPIEKLVIHTCTQDELDTLIAEFPWFEFPL